MVDTRDEEPDDGEAGARLSSEAVAEAADSHDEELHDGTADDERNGSATETNEDEPRLRDVMATAARSVSVPAATDSADVGADAAETEQESMSAPQAQRRSTRARTRSRHLAGSAWLVVIALAFALCVLCKPLGCLRSVDGLVWRAPSSFRRQIPVLLPFIGC